MLRQNAIGTIPDAGGLDLCRTAGGDGNFQPPSSDRGSPARHFLRSFAGHSWRWAIEAGTQNAPIPSITISAGHAELEEGDAALTPFARADEALYAAKRTGRNLVAQTA